MKAFVSLVVHFNHQQVLIVDYVFVKIIYNYNRDASTCVNCTDTFS